MYGQVHAGIPTLQKNATKHVPAHRQFYFQYSVMMDDGPKTQDPKNLVWTLKIEQGMQKIEKKLSKTVIKPSLGIWDIPYTALSGTTYVLGNQCIASLGSSSTVSFISSNVWNTRTNKAFKKWQRKFYYNVCV